MKPKFLTFNKSIICNEKNRKGSQAKHWLHRDINLLGL